MSALTFFEILKHNDNHDPKTGRFTYAPGGAASGAKLPDIPGTKLTEKALRKCVEIENGKLGRGTERMTLIDQGGKVINEVDGDETSVTFSGLSFEHEGPGRILTHNHPTDFGGPLSGSDIEVFSCGQLLAIRASAKEGTYHLEKGSANQGDVRMFELAARSEYDAAMSELTKHRNELQNAVQEEKLSVDDANKKLQSARKERFGVLQSKYEAFAKEWGLICYFEPREES